MSSSKTVATSSDQDKEMEAIKKIVEPYFQIFTQTQYNKPVIPISHIQTEEGFIDEYEATIWVVYGQPGCIPGKTISRFEHRAVSMINECTTAIASFLAPMREDLAKIEATVEWLRVSPVIRIAIVNRGTTPTRNHAVYQIVSKKGAQYIVDFTREQYGYFDGNWLMTRQDFDGICIQQGPSYHEPHVLTAAEIQEAEEKIFTSCMRRFIKRHQRLHELYKEYMTTEVEVTPLSVEKRVEKIIKKHRENLPGDHLPNLDDIMFDANRPVWNKVHSQE